MEKEFSSKVISVGPNVDDRDVWGDEKRLVEIVGLGSGHGFRLSNINLPKNWENSLEVLKNVDLNRFESFNTAICEKWGFTLDKMVFDPNKILKEISVSNNKRTCVYSMSLSEFYVDKQRGRYIADNLDRIEPAMIFQEIAATYFNFGWGDGFDYGHICSDPQSPMGGFGPLDLKIPKNIFNLDQIITNGHYQENFINNAFNIAGRFGLSAENIKFNDKGILTEVSVGDGRTSYYLDDRGHYDNTYVSHNVDNSYQAAALHDIVASYINFLLEGDYLKIL